MRQHVTKPRRPLKQPGSKTMPSVRPMPLRLQSEMLMQHYAMRSELRLKRAQPPREQPPSD
jgi:hypothetical protein